MEKLANVSKLSGQVLECILAEKSYVANTHNGEELRRDVLRACVWMSLRRRSRFCGHVVQFSEASMQFIVEIEKDRGNLRPVKIRSGSNGSLDLHFLEAFVSEYFPNSRGEIPALRFHEPGVSGVGVG